MAIVLRKKSKRVPTVPKRRRRRRTPCPSNSPLSQLFRHEAMREVAYDSVLMKTQIFLNAKELLSTLEGFVMNNDCGGASEFHERVRCAWQEEGIVGGVWSSWTEFPAVIEGLRNFSKTCAAEERVAAMKQDPFLLDVLKASKSAKDAKANNYVMMRGLLSILFVHWNDGDDLQKLFIAGNVMKDPHKKEEEEEEEEEEEDTLQECVSFVAEHTNDLEVLKTLLKEKHGDGLVSVDRVVAQVKTLISTPGFWSLGRIRIELYYDCLGTRKCYFFPDPKLV